MIIDTNDLPGCHMQDRHVIRTSAISSMSLGGYIIVMTLPGAKEEFLLNFKTGPENYALAAFNLIKAAMEED